MCFILNNLEASVQQQHLQNNIFFNSCERLLLGTLILDIKAGDRNLRSDHKSDLIQHQTGNGLRHASGPVRSNLPPITYIVFIG